MADSSQPAEMLRKATKKETEDEPSINQEEDAPSSSPEMKPQDMSITEKKCLTCFLYCGGERRVLPNSTFHYVGGVSEAMLIEDNVSNKELLSKIGSCLNISLHNKSIFYNTKRDKTKYLHMKDNNGVKMMFYLNEDEVDVFVDEDPFYTSTRESNIVESNKTPREKRRAVVMDQRVPVDSSSDKLKRNVVAGTSSSIDPENTEPMEEKYEWWRYIPLLKATLRGDWKTAENFFEQDKSALTAPIVRETLDTTLHIAVGRRRGEEDIHFVEKLVDLMPVEALATKNSNGYTPLHIAAWVGNTKAAKILVDKHPPLLYTISGLEDMLPIHLAALHARRDTLSYLLDVTDDQVYKGQSGVTDDQVFNGESGAGFINCLISSDFFDIALKWVERYPRLAILQHKRTNSPLEFITWKLSAFPSESNRNCFRRGSHLGFWLRKIYPHVPVKLEKCSIRDQNNRDEIEINIQGPSHARGDNRAQSIGKNISIFVHAILWKVLEFSVPQIKLIQEEKLMHVQALQLVKTLCEKITLLKDVDAYNRVVYQAMHQAIETGIPEIIQEIADWFPGLIWIHNSRNRNLFQRAIADRIEGVFNLIYQMGGHRCFATSNFDNKENNILHLAGCLGPAYRLSLVPGAALQMQRELQWFEEVKKFVHPGVMEYRNTDGETPEMVFTREHKDLVAKGEEWMKGTANSCTITAALIVTVVFAAAITIPGGNNGNTGLPIFSQEVAFIVFAVSDAISLFTSATSLLMFLSILTSRYEQGDFLYVLPKRLIIGLFTLFLSITTMMVAFSCTLYLVFGRKTAWILIPVAGLTCLPITSFVTLQFPLLVTLISSTYGKGIFGKQSNRPFY